MFALDTNTLIYFFKGMGRVADRLVSVPPSEVGIPSVVLLELEVGISQSNAADKRRSQLQRLLSVVQVLAFDQQAARLAADTWAALERRGTPIGPYDTLIAGTTLAHNAVLVTHNTEEFRRVPELRVEDWY